MWTKFRGGVYTTGIVGFVALILSAMGYIEYDPATGLITIPPFTVQALAAAVPGVLSPLVALVAVIRGWGQRAPNRPEDEQ